MVKGISRRELFGIAGAGIAALFLGEKLSSLFQSNPEFLKLVANSIREGKVLEDIGERLKTRFNPDNRVLSLGDSLTSYSESWMVKVSNKIEVISIPEIESQIAIIDITETCNATYLPLKTISCEVPTPNGTIRKIESYSLDAAMKNKPCLTLPIPQYINLGDYTDVNGVSTYGDYQYYRNYAGFRDYNGAWNNRACLRQEPSGVRGGLILTANNELIVTTPLEFTSFDAEKHDLQAQIEYACVLDSVTIESDLADLADYGYGKDLSISSEYDSTIVTFYDGRGNFRTKALSLLAKFDETNLDFGTQPSAISVTQMAQLVNEYAIKNGFSRYVMVIPDCVGYSVMSTPQSYPLEFANKHMSNDVARWAIDEVLQVTDGDNPNLYRILGANYENLVPHVAQFPVMLTSSI